MDQPSGTSLRIGAWRVNPASGQISREGETVRVEARTMRLLLCLAEHAGQVVSIDELLEQVWTGVIVTPDSVYQAITSLRRLLSDDPKHPVYIATVPRLGYRMVATVSPWVEQPLILPSVPQPTAGATHQGSKKWPARSSRRYSFDPRCCVPGLRQIRQRCTLDGNP